MESCSSQGGLQGFKKHVAYPKGGFLGSGSQLPVPLPDWTMSEQVEVRGNGQMQGHK